MAGEVVDAATSEMELAFGEGQPMGVLDLQDVPLIDSRGLEFLLAQQIACEQRGGRLTLAAANPLCRDILRCCGLSERFEMYGDARSAVGSFSR